MQEQRTGKKITCRTNECDFGGLENARAYTFRVAAVNKVGQGEWSDVSKSAYADTAPGRVENIRMKARGDQPSPSPGAPRPPRRRRCSATSSAGRAPPGHRAGSTTSLVATGLDNNTQYAFTVKALNKVNYSPPRTSELFQPLGTPAPPGTPTVADLESGADRASVRITWPSTLPEGPGPTVYTVSYSTGSGALDVPGCVKVQALTCVHSGIGWTTAGPTPTPCGRTTSPRLRPVSPPRSGGGPTGGVGRRTVVPTGANQQLRVDATALTHGARTAVRRSSSEVRWCGRAAWPRAR